MFRGPWGINRSRPHFPYLVSPAGCGLCMWPWAWLTPPRGTPVVWHWPKRPSLHRARVFQLRGGIRAFIIIEQPRNECSPVESSTHLCREGRGPPLVQACVCSITERGSSFRGAYTLVGSINKNFFFLQLGCDTCLKGGGVGASRARGGGRASSGWPSVPHIRVPGMS